MSEPTPPRWRDLKQQWRAMGKPRCEGCGAPALHADSEGIPLCGECMISCCADVLRRVTAQAHELIYAIKAVGAPRAVEANADALDELLGPRVTS